MNQRLAVLILLVVAACVSAAVFLWPWPETTELRTSKGYTVKLTVTNEWTERDLDLGDTRPVYCEVLANGETVFPMRCIGYTHVSVLPVRFLLVETRARGVVAVVERATPSVVLCLFDFRSGRAWPHTAGTWPIEDVKELLKELGAEGSISYVLSGETDRGKVRP